MTVMPIPGAQTQLRASHFQIVDEATTNYDQYRAGISGKMDDEKPHENEERWDGFQLEERERDRNRKTSFYGQEKQYQGSSHGTSHSGLGYGAPKGSPYPTSHQLSSQFRAPNPMTGYSEVGPGQTQGPPDPSPQMWSAMQYPPETPPSQRIGIPPQQNGGLRQNHGGYTTTGYGSPGRQQLPPSQQHGYATPQGYQQKATHEPAPYGPSSGGHPSDSRYGTPSHEYAGRASPLDGGQGQAAPIFGDRRSYDPTRNTFIPGP